MRIGQVVVYHHSEGGKSVARAATVVEIGDADGMVHLSYFARPIADTQRGGGHIINTAIDVPFFTEAPAPSQAHRYCTPVERPSAIPPTLLKRLSPISSQGPDVVIVPAEKKQKN